MQAPAPRFISEEEYWELEEYSNLKHEYFDGAMSALGLCSRVHNVIAANALGT